MSTEKDFAKIKEAEEILKAFGLPELQQNRISCLTLLALCNIKENDIWKNAKQKSMTLSKDIMDFVNTNYDAGYKPNSRESFRKIALKPFIENNIVLLNPDNQDLSPNSSNTHYSISQLALDCIRKYDTSDWGTAIEEFKRKQFPENAAAKAILTKITIRNYKSILDDTIELGRVNIFIGANGCGKTNILEALAMVGASFSNELDFEGLYSRGVRIARPDLTISSFLKTPKKETIEIELFLKSNDLISDYVAALYPEDPNDIYTRWNDKNNEPAYLRYNEDHIREVVRSVIAEFRNNSISFGDDLQKEIDNRLLKKPKDNTDSNLFSLLSNYLIFDLNTKSLRGVIPADSRKTPLGINGEGLDLLISNFNSYEKTYLEKCKIFFNWLEEIYSDKNDKGKIDGLKAGRSSSTLYFTDKFMQKQNNTFSAENSNEGILHVLFYIALFISNKTPNLFAIDNIETALNPRLCQALISELTRLSRARGKQALITTHNPAILDGLNLLDDEQRLFAVYRDIEGHTKTKRIKFKSDLSDKKFKLSEMWLKGLLGAIPENF